MIRAATEDDLPEVAEIVHERDGLEPSAVLATHRRQMEEGPRCWHHVVAAPIAQGLLVRASPASLVTGLAFWVVWSEASPLTDEARQVRDWILSVSRSAN